MINTQEIDLATANRIIQVGLQLSRERKLSPMSFCVLDRGGHLVAYQREDHSSIMRFEIAFGKAWGSLGLGHSTRFMEEFLGTKRPHFLGSLNAAADGKLVACIGGVLIRNAEGQLVGAVGVTGDSAANDESVAVDAIQQCGLVADLS